MAKTGKLDSVKFWERVDRIRAIRGMSVNELQTLVGKKGTYLYVARSNNALPSTEVIVNMADALNCTTDYLLDHVHHSEELDDPEVEKVLQMMKISSQFRAIVIGIMNQMS